jgi:deazaflavin-dependent oxidoreductase (nitroreductase family)
MKRRVIHALQKYVLNPPIKLMFALGVVPPGYALLETIGRRSRKPRTTPVGDGRVGDEFWIVAEHGTEAGYVRNVATNPRVRVKLREGLRMRWYGGTAEILPQDDPRARQRWLAKQRPSTWMNSMVVRAMGTSLLTVRIRWDP